MGRDSLVRRACDPCDLISASSPGDGIKMGEAIGARSIDLEWVQALACKQLQQAASKRVANCEVHPTGLVEPEDPEAKIKWLGLAWHLRNREALSRMLRFLAAEALRGVGGLHASSSLPPHMLGGALELVTCCARRDSCSVEQCWTWHARWPGHQRCW